ncbi:MAG: hypothetical protein ABJA61_08085 [Caldimonas sp.]
MTRRATTLACIALAAFALSPTAIAQGATKKELIQRLLAAQQSEIESVAHSIVERPAAQMMQEAGLAMQRQVPPEKRDAMAKAIEVEVKKYVDESYPLVRERALRIAPTTIGSALEEKLSEDELKQIVTWLESAVNKKYQQLGPDIRNAFIQKLLAESVPVVDPKVQALDARIRVILGVPPAVPATSAAPASAQGRPPFVNTKPTAPAPKPTGK